MKKFYVILILSILFAGCGVESGTAGDITIEQAFSKLFQSDDFQSRITAIVLSSQFKKTKLSNVLSERLKKVDGIEKTAILYALARSESDDYIEQFTDSIPTDEKGIKTLLDIESPRKSYFSSPALRIITYLGSLAIHNDKAFAKLKAMGHFADGWQGDSISVLVEDAEKWREKNKK
ncbi:MAG: hypothetical protein B6245_20090 [Desulfobacteraceae bacterium 4572_88]|nr:MAG: hypothetical protein B6245_20090 [Desulfobacteraceae bacterium 4572_88]